MSDAAQTSAAILGAGTALASVVITFLLGQIGSWISARRDKAEKFEEIDERERAVLHGSFALCNFIIERLNDWSEDRAIWRLTELSVAQVYLNKLLDRSPHRSTNLMVPIIDLGLRLDSLLFLIGRVVSENDSLSLDEIGEVDASADELAKAVELVRLILSNDPALISEEELAEMIQNPEALFENEEGEK